MRIAIRRRRGRPIVVGIAAVLGALLVGTPAEGAPTGFITTIAGTGTPGFFGDNVGATSTRLSSPSDVVETADGGLLIADLGNHRIRRVSPQGIITTVAGNGTAGFSGEFGPATQAQLNGPRSVSPMADGGFLIADSNNHRVRRVRGDGTIFTVAGTGVPGFNGDGNTAMLAQLASPTGVSVETADGQFLIADQGNNRIRRVSTNGAIRTVAGTGALDFWGDGGPATDAALSGPYDVAVTAGGGFLIADANNNRIRRVAPDGTITTVAGNGLDDEGSVGDGGPATSGKLSFPNGVAQTADGGMLIGSSGNNRVRRVDPAGVISTVAGNDIGFGGDGGPARAALLDSPIGVAGTGDGDYLIADTGNHRIRRVDAGPLDPPRPPPSPPGTSPPPPPPAPVDGDRDRFSPPFDCNDANAAINPFAVDVPGNQVDEDCRGGAAPYPVLDSTALFTFRVSANQTTISSLLVRRARAGSKVQVACVGRGCRFKTRSRSVKRDRPTLSLTRLVRGLKLRKDARIEVRVTKPGFIGVVSRRTIRAGKRPVRRDLCVAPGARAAIRCPD